MAEPKRSRPKSVYWSPEANPPLKWSWATDRLEASRNYWVSMTRSDGRPRSRPVWGVWKDGAFWFESYSSIAMLTSDPRVEVHLESGDEVVLFEGIAMHEKEQGALSRFVKTYNAKYRWDWDPEKPPGGVFSVRPVTAWGWISDPTGEDHGAEFERTGTRWEHG